MSADLTGKALVEHRRDRLASLVIIRERQAAELAETDEAIAECITSILAAVVTTELS